MLKLLGKIKALLTFKKMLSPLFILNLAIGSITLPPATAYESLNEICQFKQQRMPCSVVNKDEQWTISWQDGITETYQVLSGGRLQDKRGGIWTIYSRRNHTYLQHANGNVIDIFY